MSYFKFVPSTFFLLAAVCHGKVLEAVLRGTLPEPRTVTSSVYDGKDSIYIMGGIGDDLQLFRGVLKYNLNSEEVTEVSQFPLALTYGTAAMDALGDIYHFGGMDNVAYEIHATIYKLSEADRIPTEIGQLTAPVAYAGASSLGSDAIYVVGGFNRQGYETHVTEFNSTTYNVTRVADLPPLSLADITTITAHNGLIYIFDTSPFATVRGKQIWTFDPETQLMAKFPIDLPYQIGECGVVTVDDDIYVVAGNPVESDERHQMLKISLADSIYESIEISNLPLGLRAASTVFVPKLGRIYVVGGSAGFSGAMNVIYGIDI